MAIGSHARTSRRGNVEAASRDVHIDNVRAILIFTVVAGHALGTLASPAAPIMRAWIFAFHMPAFVFLAGYMAKETTRFSTARTWSNVRRLLVPYAVFQVLYVAFELVGKARDSIGLSALAYPEWPLWFLLSLFYWRVMTPVLLRLPAALVLAVAASLLVPMTTRLDWAFSVSRTFGLLPFYVLGLKLRGRPFTMLKTPAARVAGGAFLVAMVPLAIRFSSEVTMDWMLWGASYAGLDVGVPQAFAIRTTFLLVALAMTVAVIAVAPRTKNAATVWGAASVFPFVLHGFVIRPFRWSNLDDNGSLLMLLVVLALSIVVTAVLASKPVRRLFGPILTPRSRGGAARLDRS